nr:MAG TPA: hypothetical protein [Caudoviricetes sp.]
MHRLAAAQLGRAAPGGAKQRRRLAKPSDGKARRRLAMAKL